VDALPHSNSTRSDVLIFFHSFHTWLGTILKLLLSQFEQCYFCHIWVSIDELT
jgi:hypothetical protein